MRRIKTDKQLKLTYWRDIVGVPAGTPEFFELMTNEKPNSGGESWYIIRERVKDLIHNIPMVGRFLFNDRD